MLQNPGSPVVSSQRGRHAVVWVLDPDKPRSTALYGAERPRPVLYAIDAKSMALLWRSPPGQLYTSGKYNEPVVTRGMVFVGTDRVQAFGLAPKGRTPPPISSAPAAADLSHESQTESMAGLTNAILAQGRVLYLAHCASCHDQGRSEIASRAQLAEHPAAYLVEKMLLGSMQGAVLGLDDAQLQAIAGWLSSGDTDR